MSSPDRKWKFKLMNSFSHQRRTVDQTYEQLLAPGMNTVNSAKSEMEVHMRWDKQRQIVA
ncbi:hypothetical protein HanRHA438_Chr16g0750361 [Helianthus annuus]|uniref:Uncharacterized protein n=1 Tax=Helianthus annuus TaxID=4232 RepID=A0A251RY34_HELAN|nr:hypothetical protein HanXRQr2_Chr16g0738191 [Helianthus annuus]KAJ0437414.1 hypothetical protein HanHA300_Chr16g0601911 [Helianthus annuus]KAJ0441835.1 hypothetical protein HanIR_Chr16g0802361 [Helianthus annuus]KAJ0459733.1 hypothetical protein HanHA89_Chr16g0652441 [Helianthus annuus]KAJ0640205.1 hypothetical protein HanLR1_Chr16g0612711 [Helianthus annuus]